MQEYGLTLGDYDDMLTRQGGVCAICLRGNGNRPLVVDHCHESGAVRGLLCDACNKAAGMLGDNPERAQALATYLRQACPVR